MIAGSDLDRDGAALDALPVPISTPGFDNAPYLSAGHYITRDPDSGIQNVGNYRGQLKAPRRLGMNPSVELRAGIYAHWEKRKARREPLPCAVVVGCPPAVSYASVQKLPEDLDELSVAGALVGGTDQRGAGAHRRPAGAGGSRDRDRGPDRHRDAGARGAVRRVARLRQPAGVQRLHGGDGDHAPAPSDPHLLHQPGDAERIERDPARGDGAGLSASSAVGARHRRRDAGGDARAAHQPLCGDRHPVRARDAAKRGVARPLRRLRLAPLRRQVDRGGRRGYRPRRRRCAAVGDVLSLPAPA